jgi:ferritin-like metal-binding protein YciE
MATKTLKLDSLNDLYLHELEDLYDAEKQLTKALPKMAKAAHSEDLKFAFEHHLRETQNHVHRLEEIFESMDIKPKTNKCVGMEGLIEEGEKISKEEGDPSIIDAGLISAAQRVEHYEIAGYGTLKTYAEYLGEDKACDLLNETLQEETDADQKLSALAQEGIDAQAVESSEIE